MAFRKAHGLKLADNSYIQNFRVEVLTSDPVGLLNPGHVWYNNTDKLFKMSTLDSGGALIIRSFATGQDLENFINSLAANTGASLVGYDGFTGANGQFSLTSSKVDVALDSITSEIDGVKQDLADLGTGSLTAIQNEVDATQLGAGLNSDGTYTAEPTANYINDATSLFNATVQLDTQVKDNADAIADEVTNRETAVQAVQNELNAVETAVGLNSDGTFVSFSGTNYVDAATSVVNATTILDTTVKANTDAITALDSEKLDLAGGTMSGTINMSDNRITFVGDPTQDKDAANKLYVDSVAQGLIVKDAVRAASTPTSGATTLSGEQTVDGVVLENGDRFLEKNNTNAILNGIYVVNTSGAWTRASDFDGTPTNEVQGGCFTFVQEGTTNADSGWVVSTNGTLVVGTDEIEFTQFSGAGQVIAGLGLAKTGNELYINLGAGVTEGPSDSVGIDLYTNAGLMLTENGTTASTGTDAKLAIKLEDSSLEFGVGGGLKVAGAATGALQTELNTVESSVGLAADGTLVAWTTSNYMNSATTVTQGLDALDAQVKTNTDAIAAEALTRSNVDDAIQDEVDAIEASIGDMISTAGAYVPFTTSNYMNSATDVTEALVALDAQLNTVAGSGSSLGDEVDAIETAVGLTGTGTLEAYALTNYLNSASTIKAATIALDTQIKTNTDAIAAEVLARQGAVSDEVSARQLADSGIQNELDAVETALGTMVAGDGTFVAPSGTNYMGSSTSLTSAMTALDTQVKTNSDALSTLQTNINATIYTYTSSAAAASHSITHNLGSNMISCEVWVLDDDSKYRNDLVGITIESTNAITVDLTESRNIRAIIRSAATV